MAAKDNHEATGWRHTVHRRMLHEALPVAMETLRSSPHTGGMHWRVEPLKI